MYGGWAVKERAVLRALPFYDGRSVPNDWADCGRLLDPAFGDPVLYQRALAAKFEQIEAGLKAQRLGQALKPLPTPVQARRRL